MPKESKIPGDIAAEVGKLKVPDAGIPVGIRPVDMKTDDCPNAVDVDAHAIDAPVLTKQGWVCPPDPQKR